MGKLYIGLNRGQTQKDAVTSNATTGKDIEVVIDDTKSFVKSEIVQKLEEISNLVIEKKIQFQ